MNFTASGVSAALHSRSRDMMSGVSRGGMPIPRALQMQSGNEPMAQQHRGVEAMFAKEKRLFNRRYKLPDMEAMFMISFYNDRFSILACWSLALLVGLAMAVPSMLSKSTSTLALSTCGVACVVWAVVAIGSFHLRRDLVNAEALARSKQSASLGVAHLHWWLALKHEPRKSVEVNAQRQEYLVVAALLAGLLYASYLFPARGINCDVHPSCAAYIDIDAVILFFLPLPIFISPLRVCVLAPLFAFMYTAFFAAHFIPGPLAVDYQLLAAFATVAITSAFLTVLTAFFNEHWRREDFERMCLMQMDVHAMTVAREVVTTSIGYDVPQSVAKRVIEGQNIVETSICGSIAMLTLRSSLMCTPTSGPGELVQRLQRLSLTLDDQKRSYPSVVKLPCRGDSYLVACGPFASHLLGIASEPPLGDISGIAARRQLLAHTLVAFVQEALLTVKEQDQAHSSSSLKHDGMQGDAPPSALHIYEDVVCAMDTGVLTFTYASHLSECLIVGEPVERCTAYLRAEALRYRAEALSIRRAKTRPTTAQEDSDAAIITSAAFHDALPVQVRQYFSKSMRSAPPVAHVPVSLSPPQHQRHQRQPQLTSTQSQQTLEASQLPGTVNDHTQTSPPLGHSSHRLGTREEIDEVVSDDRTPSAFADEMATVVSQYANKRVLHSAHPSDESHSTVTYTPGSSNDTNAQVKFFCKRGFVLGPQHAITPLVRWSSPAKSVLHGPPAWSTRRESTDVLDTNHLLHDVGPSTAPPHPSEDGASHRSSLGRIEDDVRLVSQCLGSLVFQRTEMEDGYNYHLEELASRKHTQWMFICCGVVSVTLIVSDLIYRISSDKGGNGVALLAVALILDIAGGVAAAHFTFANFPMLFTVLYAAHCALWYGATVMEPDGTVLNNEQLIWGLLLLTLGLLREHVREIFFMSVLDLIVCIPMIVLVTFSERSMKIQAYLVVAQLIMWAVCLVTRLLRDRALRHQFAGRVLSLLCANELESDYEMMEQLLLTMVPHRIAGRLLHTLRTSLKRPTFIPSVYRLRGEEDESASDSRNTSASDEVRNTLQASLQPHIATMFSTSTVDTPFAYLTWSLPRGHGTGKPMRSSTASRARLGPLTDDITTTEVALRTAQVLLHGRNVLQDILREYNGAISVMATGDTMVLVDEACSVFDQKLVNVFESVREVFLRFEAAKVTPLVLDEYSSGFSSLSPPLSSSDQLRISQSDLQLSCVMHTGPLMGAVVGKVALSYEYYGEAMSTAKRLCIDCVDRTSAVATERFCDVLRLSWLHKRKFTCLPEQRPLDISRISTTDKSFGATIGAALPWVLCGRPSLLQARFVRFHHVVASVPAVAVARQRESPPSSDIVSGSATPASTVPSQVHLPHPGAQGSTRDPSGVHFATSHIESEESKNDDASQF